MNLLLVQTPRILPLLLSPGLNQLFTLNEILLKLSMSLITCLEQPLSRYHKDFLASRLNCNTNKREL